LAGEKGIRFKKSREILGVVPQKKKGDAGTLVIASEAKGGKEEGKGGDYYFGFYGTNHEKEEKEISSCSRFPIRKKARKRTLTELITASQRGGKRRNFPI